MTEAQCSKKGKLDDDDDGGDNVAVVVVVVDDDDDLVLVITDVLIVSNIWIILPKQTNSQSSIPKDQTSLAGV